MNKTITSNIAGYVFHIDENAYEKLEAYLNTIRSYFKDSQGRDEIIADIEARLAEMLHERMTEAKQVISMADVNHVMSIMGQPEAFLDDDPETAAWSDNQRAENGSGPKRLFRDPENQVGAGVLSGISHYVGLNDPIWLRLAFVLALFMSFGTALIAYIVLYLIIPEASTTAEKLQMRGESVTVSNIEKRVNEELESVKGKWNELHDNNGAGKRIGNFIHRLFTLVVSLAAGAIKLIGKLIGLAFLIVGAIGFITIVGTPFGLPTTISMGNDGVVSSFEVQEILQNLLGGTDMMWLSYVCFILLLGVPLLAMAYIGSRLLFQFKKRIPGVGISLVLLWIIGVVMAAAVSSKVASDFSSQGGDTQTIELALSENPDQTIHLGLNHELGDDEPTEEVEIFDIHLLASGTSTQLYGKPELDINMAKTGGPKLIVKRSARAKKKQDAVERASKIDYGFAASDTSILFNGYFSIPEDELWRTQNVELELLLPVGYTVYLSDEMMQIIYDIDNVTNTYDGDMVGRRWTMTPEGLKCVDCDGLEDPLTSIGSNLDIDIDVNIARSQEAKEEALEAEQLRLEREMEMKRKELEKLQQQLKEERETSDNDTEEASSAPQEILLRRVIDASYWVTPTLHRTVRVSYPG
ncbi:MAG: PspC domain-containing protein [Bacteroidetes bacterium]|nr:MAG: PspC domain-containing protein [Bacteroidota bacterium]